jgi:hypothetical protein
MFAVLPLKAQPLIDDAGIIAISQQSSITIAAAFLGLFCQKTVVFRSIWRILAFSSVLNKPVSGQRRPSDLHPQAVGDLVHLSCKTGLAITRATIQCSVVSGSR